MMKTAKIRQSIKDNHFQKAKRLDHKSDSSNLHKCVDTIRLEVSNRPLLSTPLRPLKHLNNEIEAYESRIISSQAKCSQT